MSNVFILDNSIEMNSLFSTLLSFFNHSVDTATTKSALFQLLGKKYPDLLIIDILLEGNDGREICREVKEKYPHLPVILTSASQLCLENFQKFGAIDILEKPFDIENLRSLIEKWSIKNQ